MSRRGRTRSSRTSACAAETQTEGPSNHQPRQQSQPEGSSEQTDHSTALPAASQEAPSTATETPGTHWQPWQDRLLAAEVYNSRPFEVSGSRESAAAWDDVAARIRDASRKSEWGVDLIRTGEACKARMQRLLKAHKRAETASLQKTGTDEEINDFLRCMTELCQLYDAHDEQAHQSKRKAARKALEALAGAELRDASMRGMVSRCTLTDVTATEGTSHREIQAQRPSKRHRTWSFSDGESEKENAGHHHKRHRHSALTALQGLVAQRVAADSKRLAEAREREDQRFAENQAMQHRILEGITTLTDVIRQSEEQRRLDRERELQAQVSAQQNMLQLMTTLLQLQNTAASSAGTSRTSHGDSRIQESSSSSSMGAP